MYCTSGSYINNTKEIYNYGIVSTRIKMENVFQEKKLDWDIKFFGEATEVEKKQESNIIFKSNR